MFPSEKFLRGCRYSYIVNYDPRNETTPNLGYFSFLDGPTVATTEFQLAVAFKLTPVSQWLVGPLFESGTFGGGGTDWKIVPVQENGVVRHFHLSQGLRHIKIVFEEDGTNGLLQNLAAYVRLHKIPYWLPANGMRGL